jgi:hypothetical protein
MNKFSPVLALTAALTMCSAAHAQHYQMRKPLLTLHVQEASTNPSTPPTPVPASTASLSANSLNFGDVNVGQTGSLALSLLNTGNQPLTLGAISSGDNVFSASTSCSSTLSPGQSCPISVVFQPLSGQPYSSSLTVNAGTSDSPLTVALSGTGVQALAALSANTSADFGQVVVGQSASRTFTLTNKGNGPATNVAASVTATSLSLNNNSCGTSASPVTVQAGGSCSLTVTYSPTAAGSLSGNSLKANWAESTTPATLDLTGSAILPSDPYWANVTYLLHMDGPHNSTAFTDVKGASVTRLGNPVVSTAVSKFGGAAAQFTGGLGNALSLPAFAPTGNFTIEAWLYISSANSGQASTLIDVGGISGVNWQSQAIYYGWPTAGQLNWLASSGNNGTDISGPVGCATPCSTGVAFGAPVMDAWNHFAVVRDASAGKYYFYLNGTKTLTVNNSSTPYASPQRVVLGAYPVNSATNFTSPSLKGYLDEVRFSNGVARYTGTTYTMPTAAFPSK